MEDKEHQAEHVERGQRRCDQGEQPQDLVAGLERLPQNFVLAEKTRETRRADNSQGGDEECPIGIGNFSAERPHLTYVLLSVHGVDHTARRQKQQGFEKRVGHQMENTGRKSTHAQPQEHVTELADGGVGQNFLDVSLHQTDGGGIESGQATDSRHRRQREGRVGKEDVRAGDHVDAGGDHGGSVDERTDRRGAFHRVRQPDVERQLCRLADRAHQQ